LEFVEQRINVHAEGYFESDVGGELPECTEDEMWEKKEVFAVKKEGGVRAKSLHSTYEEARAALPSKGYFVERRPGERTRCANYCQVSQFCTQYRDYISGSMYNSHIIGD